MNVWSRIKADRAEGSPALLLSITSLLTPNTRLSIPPLNTLQKVFSLQLTGMNVLMIVLKRIFVACTQCSAGQVYCRL